MSTLKTWSVTLLIQRRLTHSSPLHQRIQQYSSNRFKFCFSEIVFYFPPHRMALIKCASSKWRGNLFGDISHLREEGNCADVRLVAGVGSTVSLAHSLVLAAVRLDIAICVYNARIRIFQPLPTRSSSFIASLWDGSSHFSARCITRWGTKRKLNTCIVKSF